MDKAPKWFNQDFDKQKLKFSAENWKQIFFSTQLSPYPNFHTANSWQFPITIEKTQKFVKLKTIKWKDEQSQQLDAWLITNTLFYNYNLRDLLSAHFIWILAIDDAKKNRKKSFLEEEKRQIKNLKLCSSGLIIF